MRHLPFNVSLCASSYLSAARKHDGQNRKITKPLPRIPDKIRHEAIRCYLWGDRTELDSVAINCATKDGTVEVACHIENAIVFINRIMEDTGIAEVGEHLRTMLPVVLEWTQDRRLLEFDLEKCDVLPLPDEFYEKRPDWAESRTGRREPPI